jgi:hypothetical protein
MDYRCDRWETTIRFLSLTKQETKLIKNNVQLWFERTHSMVQQREKTETLSKASEDCNVSIVIPIRSTNSSNSTGTFITKRKHPTTTTKRSRSQRPSSSHDNSEIFVQEQQQDYYDRLIYQCRKDLNKQIKITKKFEIQKQIRKIKEMTTTHTSSTTDKTIDARKNQVAVANQEKKLQHLKEYSFEPVIRECFRRLGILQLDPRHFYGTKTVVNELESDDVTNQSNIVSHTTTESVIEIKQCIDVGSTVVAGVDDDCLVATDGDGNDNVEQVDDGWILERIMKHKTILSALEQWNDEVTEYRRWCLRQQERNEMGTSEFQETSSKKKNKTKGNAVTTTVLNEKDNLLGNGASLFVTLGKGKVQDDVDDMNDSHADPFSYYGPGGDDTNNISKRNRQGQRGRRAKAAALEAKKRGRTLRPEESLNWRQSTSKSSQGHQSRDCTVTSNVQAKNIATSKPSSSVFPKKHDALPPSQSTPLPIEQLHPSWQARKVQKESIVAFQGKKITFDNDE